jgi:predicted GIY-YIG superfamily endonuclease
MVDQHNTPPASSPGHPSGSTRPQRGVGVLFHAQHPEQPAQVHHATIWTVDLARYLPRVAAGHGHSRASEPREAADLLQVVRTWPDCTRAWFREQVTENRGWVDYARYCPRCLQVPVELLEFYEARRGQGVCYLLHFDQPVGRARRRHYVGFTTDLPRRYLQHRRGVRPACRPARQAARLGIGIRLARTWFPGTLQLERQLKQADDLEQACRLCQTANPAAPANLSVSGRPAAEPTHGRPWRPDEDQELLHAFDTGTRLVELAERLERSKGQVRARLSFHGKLTRWGAHDDLQLRLAAAAGVPIATLAERFGRTPGDVQARLDRHSGLALQRRRHPNGGTSWTRELERELVRRFDSDQPINDIANALGRTRGAIRSRLVRLGKLDPSEEGSGDVIPAAPMPSDDSATPGRPGQPHAG